ncbi:translocator protein-like [Paramacrobiotus metropolitanus]|uniref:translocator protein-like n=1 Tax=Paramacrobiotus metropolitanus TaxID=2943436 RepID=UPI002445A6E9|nr:translocator protein-like [Paramacrobiotus metropolitanus]
MGCELLFQSRLLTELLPAIVLPNIGGIIGAIITKEDVKIYERLRKPSWSPPKWLFGPMWTTLYVLMGAASLIVYKKGNGFTENSSACLPLMLYGSQLILNWAWSPLFFRARKPGLALLDIGVLWINIAACVVTFFKVDTTAGTLLLPYLAWVTLATALNYNLWKDNSNIQKLK